MAAEQFSDKVREEIAIKKEVWQIGIPAIMESLFTTLISIVNTKMVAVLGIAAISAVSVTNQPRLFLLSIFFALNTSVSALVARHYGAQEQRKANTLLVSSIVIASILSIVISVLCVILAPQIMQICSGQADTMAMSITYYRLMMGGLIINVLFMLINSALRGCGYTKVTLVSNVVSFIVNIIVNYLLIGGHLGFPALGVAGSAIATIAGNTVALGISIFSASRAGLFINFRYCLENHIGFSMASIKEIQDMWQTITVENLMTRIGFLITGMITARIGSYDMSVYSIGITLMNVSFAFGDGFQSATVALIGRAMGSNDHRRISQYKHAILRSGIQCAIVLALIIGIGGRPYYMLFSQEAEFLNKGMITAIIIACVIPIQILQLIYNGILKTMGRTKETLLAAVISVTVVNPLITYVAGFAMGYGIWGIWAATACAQVTRTLILVWLYRKRVREDQ